MVRLTSLLVLVAACVSRPVAVGSPPGGTTPSTAASDGAADVAATIVRLTNRERARAGLAALATSAKLVEAARIQAAQMAAVAKAEHVIPGARYPAPLDRLAAVGYRWAATAENVAWNHADAASVVAAWMRSPAHRTNMLNTAYTEMGAAVARDARGQPYYAQVFGRPLP